MINNKQRLMLAMIATAFIVPIVMLLINVVQQSPANDLKDYLTRIARVQDEPVVDWQHQTFHTPTRRSFFTPIERLTIGLIESAELRKCDLLELVYLHNDALGKVQDEFRNLDYQVAVLSGLKFCIQQGNLSGSLTTKLSGIYQKKWQQLPYHIGNALYYSTASHKQRFSEQWLPSSTRPNVQFYRDYSLAMSQLLEGYESLSLPINFTSTPYQESLEKNRYMGQLFYTLHSTNQWLSQINLQLEKYDGNIECGLQKSSERLSIMMNIFSQVYVTRLQPYFAHLNQHYLAVKPLLDIYQHPILSYNERYLLQSEYEQFKKHLVTHVNYWTGLRERCGLSMEQLMGDSAK